MDKKIRLMAYELKKDLKEVINGITKKDIFLLLTFPCLITLFMFLPAPLIEALKLNIRNPLWWQYLTNIWVHNDWKHYTANIFAYFVYMVLLLLIANLGNIKKKFYKLFLFTLISLPIFSSFIQVISYPIIFSWLPNLKYSAGSSGIVSALGGFLPIFWIVYIKKKNSDLKIGISFMLFFMTYIALVFGLDYGQKTTLILFLFIIFGVFFLINLNLLKISIYEIIKEVRKNPIIAWVMIMIPLFFIITPYILFPSVKNLFSNSSFIDIGLHYVGIAYGLTASGLYFLLKKK